MTFLTQHGPLVTGLLALPPLLIFTALFFWSLKRYEVMVALVFVSPWVHWIFASNEELATTAEVLEEAETTGPGTYLRLLVIAAAGLAGLLYYLRAKYERKDRLPVHFALLGVFLVVALLSTSYSIAKQFTFVRSSEGLVFLVFLAGMYMSIRNARDLDAVLKLLTVLMALGLVINAAALVLVPGRVWWWEAPQRFQGVTDHPNEMGAFCMIALPLFMWRYRRSEAKGKAACLLLMCLALGLLVLSGSRASFGCAMAGLLLWHFLLDQRMASAVVVVMLAVGGLVLSSSLLPSLSREQATEEKITDLTGREQFWQHGLELVQQRPLRGYGYEVSGEVWTDPRFSSAQMEAAWGSARTSLHNGYLSAVIGLGVILGLVVWPLVLVFPLAGVLRLPKSDYRALCAVVLVVILMSNFVETSITSSRSFTSVCFWCFWVIASALPVVLPRRAEASDAVREMAPLRVLPDALGREAVS